jgi:hypothetical protein
VGHVPSPRRSAELPHEIDLAAAEREQAKAEAVRAFRLLGAHLH